MDENLKKALLQSIEAEGSAEVEFTPVRVIVNGQLSNILDRSSGKARIRAHRVNQFHLILSQPKGLLNLSPLEIRCLNCHRVISYPAWHLELKFDRNTFEYFLCFSETSVVRASLNCRGK